MFPLELAHWLPISISSMAIIRKRLYGPVSPPSGGRSRAKSRQQIDRRIRGRGCPPRVIHRSFCVDFSRYNYLPAIGSRPRRWHCWRAASRFSASLKLHRCLRSPRDGSTSADAGNFSRFWSRYRHGSAIDGGDNCNRARPLEAWRFNARGIYVIRKIERPTGGDEWGCREQDCRDESELQNAPRGLRNFFSVINSLFWYRLLARIR